MQHHDHLSSSRGGLRLAMAEKVVVGLDCGRGGEVKSQLSMAVVVRSF